MQVLKSQKGNALTVVLLIILPLIVLFTIASVEHNRAVIGTDLDMQQALNDACRSAALCVQPLSQAHNDPMIEPDAAHLVFRYVLQENLGLDDNMNPTDKSGMKSQVNYVLIVYNGKNDYNLPEAVKYTPSNTAGDKFTGTLPEEFVVKSTDITTEGEGIKTELDKPGCIAVISTDLKPVITGDSSGVRWSSAKIIN